MNTRKHEGCVCTSVLCVVYYLYMFDPSTYAEKKYGTGHVTLATSLPGLPVAVDSESVLQSSQVITPRFMMTGITKR